MNSQVLYVGQPYTAPETMSDFDILSLRSSHLIYLPPLRVLENVHQGGCSLAIKRDRGGAPPAPDRVAATCLCAVPSHALIYGETD